MKDAAFSDGIFSIIVGYRSRVSHNDRQCIDLLCNCHRSCLLYWIAEKLQAPLSEKKLCSGCINHCRNRAKNRAYYRRITAELHNRNILLNHKTVQRLMKELGLICRVRMKKYRSYKGEVGKIAPNLLNRDFHADKPNQKWVTDVTEFSLFGEKLYLSPILDLCSSDLVSYIISDRPVLSMVTTMLDKAFEKIPDDTSLILHSDQGWQYQHKQYQRMLQKKGIRQSMSRKGNCLDNAVMENFFSLLKSELLYLQEFDSMDHFKRELIEYLDYYNNRRIKAKLKGLPPAIHRQQTLSAA